MRKREKKKRRKKLKSKSIHKFNFDGVKLYRGPINNVSSVKLTRNIGSNLSEVGGDHEAKRENIIKLWRR